MSGYNMKRVSAVWLAAWWAAGAAAVPADVFAGAVTGGRGGRVARRAAAAPGTASVFTGFSFPSISPTGEVAFHAFLSDSPFSSDEGVWSEVGDALSLIVREGSPAPGGGVIGFSALFGRDDHVSVYSGGDVAFSGTRLWSGGAATLREVAGPSVAVPGVPSAEFQFVETGAYVTNPARQVALRADLQKGIGGVTSANDLGTWGGTPGQLQLIAREGDPAVGMPGNAYHDVGYPVINDQGHVAFCGNIEKGLTAVGAIWAGTPGALNLIATSQQPAPGAPDGALFDYFRNPSINRSGQVLFSGGNGDKGLWLAGPGASTPTCIAYAGTPAPGTAPGVTFQYFGPSTFNDHGDIVFQAGLQGPGVDPIRNHGVWAIHNGQMRKLIRERDPEPGSLGGDSAISESDDMTPIINDNGTIVLKAYKGNDRTLFAFDASGDLLRTIQSGVTPLDLGSGDLRTPTELFTNVAWTDSFSMPFSVGSNGEDGRVSPLDNADRLVFYAGFSDGSVGVFVATVPEPGSGALLLAAGAAGLLGIARRRRRK